MVVTGLLEVSVGDQPMKHSGSVGVSVNQSK